MKEISINSRLRIRCFNDGSTLVETFDVWNDNRRTGVPLNEDEHKRLTRFFSRGERKVYVVKSRLDTYVTISEPDEGRILPIFDWTRDRAKAVRFTSKAGARALAGLCSAAGARVVRVRRRGE